VRLVAQEPVNARLAETYRNALATGQYRRDQTEVLCAGCSGRNCELYAEPETTARPWWSRLLQKVSL
jgi:hypothetical protein